ncbi:zinc ribbon domain-containing protein [Phormidium sp. CCY1219]|uniref:zinc ribbon domain-containing protein n=1 Tax=Phormidium sp. CCY1219 TaxID=2886104 RepID=UPI002D1F7413|nr:zinc ribbon domain-containing protein [Phormidium sp. CCY1219]MEB3828387.1 zinc ribbon domain-containing protein [Phormidium sp. CCY1219]
MSECPKCHQPIDTQATNCPYCRTPLKGFGHAGIPLHRSTSDEYLCVSCTYHEDDTCNFPQRPYAKTCTLYHDKSEPLVVPPPQYQSRNPLMRLQRWWKRHPAAIALGAIVLVSLLLALGR